MPPKILGLLFLSLFAATLTKAQCDSINVPNAVVTDLEYCHGMSVPVIEASIPNNDYQVFWYDSDQNGNLIFEGIGFTPNNPGMYYAEVVHVASGCLSDSRMSVEVVEFPALSYSIVEQECINNEYYISFTIAGGSDTPVEVNAGEYEIEKLEEDLYQINNIPTGVSPIITIHDFHCNSAPLLMIPMNCSCETGSVPNAEMTYDSEVCFGEAPMSISATSPDDELFIQWYDAPIEGNLLHTGREFTPDEFGLYYVELSTSTGCVSDSRRIVQASENLELSLNAVEKKCMSENKEQFEVKLQIEGGIGFGFGLEISTGTLDQVNETEFWIRDIDSDVGLEVLALDNLFCSSELLTIESPPGCINPHNNNSEPEYEEGKTINLLAPTAFTPNGDGDNDFWKLSNKTVVEAEVMVFNRWGKMVYFSQNVNDEWDGTFKGKQVGVGVYPMMIKATLSDGQERIEKSSITILY